MGEAVQLRASHAHPCNAASSVLPAAADICGVIRPTIEGMAHHPSGSLHVIGGAQTIRSGIYQRVFPQATFQIAQPLSARIERADIQGVHQLLPQLLHPDRTELLCACTHYEAIEALYFQYMPRLKKVFLPSIFTLSHLEKHWELAPGEQEDSFFTSGEVVSVGMVVEQVFGISWPNPIQQIVM